MQHYWNKPETADCTIIIPLPSTARRITLHLHRECLSAKSLFLKSLFTGSSPLDLIQILSASPLHPRSRLPRLLPSPQSHPVLFLPVPDPFTIEPLFHWMYFGNTDHIENALDKGDIQWQGLARNVEYLGLCTDIKVFLGTWYRHWLLPARCPPADPMPCATDEDEESDLDSECDDSDHDDDYYYSPSSPLTDDDDEIQSDDECDRGRTRDIKPLVRLCARLRLFNSFLCITLYAL
ncbi:hypothetical protein J3R83DRAFT_9401 [Lanmaoa asiatica]|nr:hypothetical protein J3R83DRAFT_9401 [Lanmaoa asiatica]